MELDSRIKKGKRPLTCLDVEQAREFEGKLCLFSDAYANYKNVQEYIKHHPKRTGILNFERAEPLVNGDLVFRNANEGVCYSLVLPCEWVEQPKTPEFEPYTLDTWGQDFKPGNVVFFRGKEDTPKENNYYKCMYLGYLENENNRILVILGPWLFTFFELFELYEIYRNGNWEPFGRKTTKG